MCHNKTKRPADLSIVKRLGGFSWCKCTAFILNSQTFLKKKNKSSLRNIFWNNESYAIKHYMKMFADLDSATLKQVADWFGWLASTSGRFFDERSGRSTSRKGGACYRRDARKPSAMPTSSDVPTMKSTTLQTADTMGEYRSTSKDLLDR